MLVKAGAVLQALGEESTTERLCARGYSRGYRSDCRSSSVLARRSVYDVPTLLICGICLAVLIRGKVPEPVLIAYAVVLLTPAESEEDQRLRLAKLPVVLSLKMKNIQHHIRAAIEQDYVSSNHNMRAPAGRGRQTVLQFLGTRQHPLAQPWR